MVILWMVIFLSIFVGGFVYFAYLAASKERDKEQGE